MLISNQKIVRNRAGLSMIEVLTSIVVAMIGVFGVMVMIPFAVKQAKSGLDSDAAVGLARNAVAEFEIRGYRNAENWVIADSFGAIRSYNPFDPITPDLPQIFSIDPLAIAEIAYANNPPANAGDALPLPTVADMTSAIFPFNRQNASLVNANPYPNNLLINAINLGLPSGVPMDVATARKMFRSANDLVFGEATDELLGPQQYFDQNGVAAIRRSSQGRISWSAIVVPVKEDNSVAVTTRWSYRMYVLIYKERQTLIGPLAENQMTYAQVDPTLNQGLASPVSNVFLEPSVTTIEGAVKRDDWVMMINRSLNVVDDGPPPPGVTYAEKGFDRQIGFFRVVGISDAGVGVSTSLTLDGPDFYFANPGDIVQDTFVVHLKDVVGVYERTFSAESQSNWNLAAP